MRKDTGIQLQRVDYGMIKIKKWLHVSNPHMRARILDIYRKKRKNLKPVNM